MVIILWRFLYFYENAKKESKKQKDYDCRTC